MTYYLRVMLGGQSVSAKDCFRDGIVGTDFDFNVDLTNYLKPSWNESKRDLTRIFAERRPEKSPIAIGLNCGSIWTVSKGIPVGGVIVSPTGDGDYTYGVVTGEYKYAPDSYFPHQRDVQWSGVRLSPEVMSDGLLKTCKRPLTSIDLNPYAEELDSLIGKTASGPRITVSDSDVESATHFALESILEDFLVANWQYTAFAKNYDILSVDGEQVGQQFPSDTGRIDILAISKDQSEYLVLELKRGRASDRVVGQLLRYMGYIKKEYCQDGKKVRGAIVAHQDDLSIRNALSMVQGVDFYLYEVDFKLSLQS
jgi:restriction system protein